MEKLTVNAPSRTYDILIGWDLLPRVGGQLMDRGIASPHRPVAVLTSPRIGGHYFDAVRLSLEESGTAQVGRKDIPDGEKHKNLDEYAEALEWLSQIAGRPGETPLIITLGGGVVGDLGGFVAHTFKRGTPFVQVTTTLLGAVDCSVGGKVAVNLPAGKNLVGAFHQPSLVVADLSCLRTLPEREIKSGMAEVIKYGAALDGDLFGVLEENIEEIMQLDRDLLVRVVKACCEIKARVVNRDELDNRGVRISLNFGHTLGHAIENVCGYALTHGECISIGMAAAVRISERLGLCASGLVDRIESLLVSAGLPVKYDKAPIDGDKVLEVMKRDKKWADGRNRFVLLTDVGAWKEVEGVDMDLVEKVVEEVL